MFSVRHSEPDVRRRGEILARLSVAFLMVTLSVAPVVVFLELGEVGANLGLVAAGVVVYLMSYVLARRGQVDVAGGTTAGSIVLFTFLTFFTMGGLNGFQFLGALTPLIVSLVASRRYIWPLALFNGLGVLVLFWMHLPIQSHGTGPMSFLAALAMVHACTALVAWFYSARATEAFREVVESKRALELAILEARAANDAKSGFLANMSHELRTPLNAIIGYAEMAEEQLLDEGRPANDPVVTDLQKVEASSRHLLSLIAGVLDLSKVEAGKLEMQLEWVELADVVEGTRVAAAALMRPNGNRLVVGDLPTCSLHTDPLRLKQILLNLLSNAAKFTSDGTVSLEVRVGTSIEIDVNDTGIGMDAETIERVFEPFVQADGSTTRAFGGTGLGLALSRRFAMALGGSLTARSQAGVGSTFSLVLPVGRLQNSASPGAD